MLAAARGLEDREGLAPENMGVSGEFEQRHGAVEIGGRGRGCARHVSGLGCLLNEYRCLGDGQTQCRAGGRLTQPFRPADQGRSLPRVPDSGEPFRQQKTDRTSARQCRLNVRHICDDGSESTERRPRCLSFCNADLKGTRYAFVSGFNR